MLFLSDNFITENDKSTGVAVIVKLLLIIKKCYRFISSFVIKTTKLSKNKIYDNIRARGKQQIISDQQEFQFYSVIKIVVFPNLIQQSSLHLL